jgi:hypothetical protein
MRKSSWVGVAAMSVAGVVACGAEQGVDAMDVDGADPAVDVADDDVGTASQAIRGGSQAFAWVADPPQGPSVPVHPDYSHSTVSNSPILANRSVTGVFNVTFPGLGSVATSGNVQVVAYGQDSKRCKAESWERVSAGSPDMVVVVRCHQGLNGQLSNSNFVVRFASAPTNGSGPGGYLRIANPSADAPTVQRGFNSANVLNSVFRDRRGEYRVLFRNLAQPGGAVQVTAFGRDSEHCKVLDWRSIGADMRVKVNCFDFQGLKVDTPFSINFIGTPGSVGVFNHGAFAWADRPDLTDYEPRADYSKNTGATTASCNAGNTAGRIGNFLILRHFDMPEIDGSPHVTAWGDGPNYCKLAKWDRPDGSTRVEVSTQCYNGVGQLDLNTVYAETYATKVSGLGCQ